LKVFGHEKLSVLDGGLPKWIAEKREIESGPVSFTVKINKFYFN
jgi:thiosulfate/3-mercaptopyruvate sulfurtransferase